MNLKILLINDKLHAGGAELALQNFSACLAARGHSLTLWAQQGDRELLSRKYPPSVKYCRLPFWDGPCRRFSPKWFFNRGCRLLFEDFLLRLRKWDVVVAFKEGPSMRLAAKLRAGKKFAWVHTDFKSLHWSAHSFHSPEEELACMRRFDKVICVSRAGAEGVIQTLGDPGNLCVRYNPLNVRAISASAAIVPADCVRPLGKPLFVALGRLSAVKRYDMLLDICGALEKQFDFELWIIGGGEEEEALQAKLRSSGIKSVRLLGNRDNPYPYLAAADWFVSSSASESHPIALQEALVLGVPAIASFCPAVAETLDSRFGLVTGADSASLLAGLRRALLEPALAGECRANIRRFYDKERLWEGRLREMYSLLEE